MAVGLTLAFEAMRVVLRVREAALQLMKLLADHWPIVIDSMTCFFSLIRVLPNFCVERWYASGGSAWCGRIGKI